MESLGHLKPTAGVEQRSQTHAILCYTTLRADYSKDAASPGNLNNRKYKEYRRPIAY
ncbi:hypothetical protein FBZ99_106294 [Rhizobium sp. ERR 1071]|nr:hypothetical protein FBZ99_106294 [Rhizobium sp. ERR1071]